MSQTRNCERAFYAAGGGCAILLHHETVWFSIVVAALSWIVGWGVLNTIDWLRTKRVFRFTR